ncbi:ABC transporter permease [Rhodospirillum rubrum]|uniref:ABC transporter substrate-binding protein n=1 Tax=Rhodospirillum rubrum TaxID=1085 RepID=UPI001904DD59|nr:ABC transporter substrate-binding protein [Rhodospirillum rubrum]MBK1665275.1 ABC transporter permease [Rhodospirillum rubrum]MBK1677125.1 ABC transporter permease [Rhodospirillum rubrum]
MTFTPRRALISALLLGLAPYAQAAEISDKVIRIGVLNDQSGVYADIAGTGSVEAARMAAEEFGGEIDGAKIEFVSADHQNKADIAANIANKWIDTDGVDAIVDIPNSSAMLAVQEIGRTKKRIVIASGGGSTDFTGPKCSPYGFHWTYDTYSLAKGTAESLVKDGGTTWYNIVVDYAFGHSLDTDTSRFITQAGGQVVGRVLHPLGTSDFSSYLLQAQGSGAKVIGVLNAGADTVNAIKQAAEFGISRGGQILAGLLIFDQTVHSLGLETAQGLRLTTGFYWDRTDATRAWSAEFLKRTKNIPSMAHAGVYSGVRHYLAAIKAAGTDNADAVAAKMRETPVNDMFAENGTVRADGRMVHDMYLMEVKKPADSTSEWDLMRLVHVIPGEEAYRPLAEGGCPLVQ